MGRHREARDRDQLAPRGLRSLLEVALEGGKTAWSASHFPPRARPGSENVERERVGCSTDPRGVAAAGVQRLRAHCVALHAAASPLAGAEAEVAHVLTEKPRADRHHGLLFVVPTATFRLLYVWFAIRHSRREVVHWSVTESRTRRGWSNSCGRRSPSTSPVAVPGIWSSTGTRSSRRR
jgi:hypothetical protein